MERVSRSKYHSEIITIRVDEENRLDDASVIIGNQSISIDNNLEEQVL